LGLGLNTSIGYKLLCTEAVDAVNDNSIHRNRYGDSHSTSKVAVQIGRLGGRNEKAAHSQKKAGHG